MSGLRKASYNVLTLIVEEKQRKECSEVESNAQGGLTNESG